MAPSLGEHLSGALDRVAGGIGLGALVAQKDVLGVRRDTVDSIKRTTFATFQIQEQGGLIGLANSAADRADGEGIIEIYNRAISAYREAATAATELGDNVVALAMNSAAEAMGAIVVDIRDNKAANVVPGLLDDLREKLADVISC